MKTSVMEINDAFFNVQCGIIDVFVYYFFLNQVW